jgi:hypothetical protein
MGHVGASPGGDRAALSLLRIGYANINWLLRRRLHFRDGIRPWLL